MNYTANMLVTNTNVKKEYNMRWGQNGRLQEKGEGGSWKEMHPWAAR